MSSHRWRTVLVVCVVYLSATHPILAQQVAVPLSPAEQRFQQNLTSAETGDPDAQYEVGNAYFFGRGTGLNNTKAREWLLKAADQGQPKALYRMGYIYLNGIGVKKNTSTAVKYLTKAANKNYAPAQYELGLLYADGIGVNANYNSAIDLLKKSEAGGYRQAKKAMERLKARRPSERPKVAKAAPKPKKSVARKPARTASPKPASAKPKKPNKAASIRRRLLNEEWYKGNDPADILPSAITLCTNKGKTVVCISTRGSSNTTATLSGFTNRGRFRISATQGVGGAKSLRNKKAAQSSASKQNYNCTYQGWQITCRGDAGVPTIVFTNQPQDLLGASGL
ncbi:MAG: hypothetical protein BMS9Abin15_0527 [Gammaproteobacteria bacterium]|nr:MAG: hypothetical protein BMS9Abin15_0527 [Gammaproteobacteria bacterium]